MAETKTYEGGCHCGNVRFRVKADLSNVYACNCSMCSRMGWRLAFVPEADFELVKGDKALTDYQFHKMHIHHLFCSTCGIRSYGQEPSSRTSGVSAARTSASAAGPSSGVPPKSRSS